MRRCAGSPDLERIPRIYLCDEHAFGNSNSSACSGGGCEYATPIASPATVLVDARTACDLSRKHLAKRAGVPTSTVSRIEEGVTDPTVGMLDRLLAAAGRSLVVDAADPPQTSLARLVDAWHP